MYFKYKYHYKCNFIINVFIKCINVSELMSIQINDNLNNSLKKN